MPKLVLVRTLEGRYSGDNAVILVLTVSGLHEVSTRCDLDGLEVSPGNGLTITVDTTAGTTYGLIVPPRPQEGGLCGRDNTL